MKIPFQQTASAALIAIEIAILSALILATRCANYQEVFVGGNIYFTDGDCYARMIRVHMCSEHPGLIVRHHDFENFPTGTTPHTTAPFDYLILALSILLKPLTAHAIDLAGAFISPLLALIGGWFLWWWSRWMKFRYRWAMLILYAISPIIVHGTDLGRPDHQSLSILLVTIAICAEWILYQDGTRAIEVNSRKLSEWAIVSGIAWGFALWVSAYEPLVLLLLILACGAVADRPHPNLLPAGEGTRLPTGSNIVRSDRNAVTGEEDHLSSLLPLGEELKMRAREGAWEGVRVRANHVLGKHRRIGWSLFGAIIAIALLIERRVPSLPIFHASEIFKNWAGTIGELAHVSPANPIWLRWAGYLILLAPFLLWLGAITRLRPATAWQASKSKSQRNMPAFIVLLLVATYGLTIWQARWAYFFVLIFALALPSLLEPIKSRAAVWVAFALSILPILHDWDERIWPNDAEAARRIEQRNDSVQLRDLAVSLKSSEARPFLAPWWLSPSIAYWSGQPGVGGSSHESLNGNADAARFFLAEDWRKAREILENRNVAWVFAYDAERVAQNSSALLGLPVPGHALCFVLDRTPTQVPTFLIFSAQNGAGKLYRFANKL